MRIFQTAAVVLILLLILCHTGSGSANPPAKPLNHPYKVYLDQRNQNLYWPLAKPFWIRLATGPEPDAPSYLLEKAIVKSPETGYTDKNIEQGIQLEVSGRQFLRWFNYVTKDTVMLKFNADGNVPVTNHDFSGAPQFDSGRILYFGRNLKATVSAHDSTSGVEEKYVSIDGAKYEPYQGEFFFNREKAYSLRYYAVDKVGNVSPPLESKFTVDLSPPFTTYKVMENFSGNILSPATVINLSSLDKLSDVQKIAYQFDADQQELIYSGSPVSITHLRDGEHTLNFHAEDNVRNVENAQKYTFYLDKTPPLVTRSVLGDQYSKGGKLYVSTRSRIELAASDNKIGVLHIEQAVNTTKFSVYTEPFAIPFNATDSSIAYRGLDKLGNTSKTAYYPVTMDLTPPVTDHSFSGSNYTQRGITWINRSTKVSLAATDDGSGVKTTQYQIGIDPISTYGSQITIPNEGNFTFKYWSIDQVNNREQDRVFSFNVDNTPPEIFESFSVSSINTITLKSGSTAEVYPLNTSIFLGATDASSSVNGLWYKINKDQETKYEMPVTFGKEGTYTLSIRTVDKVDNETTRVLTFVIKD